MNRIVLVLILILTVTYPLRGQKIVPTPEDLYADAGEFMESGDYADALPLFLTLKDRGYATANINYLIGECYLNLPGLKTKAIPFLKEAINNVSARYSGTSLAEEAAPARALLFLGIACRLNYDFDNALMYFNSYMQNLDDTDIENRRMAEYHIERCRNARDLMDAPALYTADTLPLQINTTFSNFNPLVTPDEKVMYYMNQLKFYDAVMRVQQSGTGWSEPENLTPLIKSDGDHYVTGTSSDGDGLLLTCYDPYMAGELYTTTFKEGTWSPLQKMEGINTVFNETHASLSPDGKWLYFTSDRKGGYGGLDIYRSALDQQGKWSTPVNLGPLINSSYNEESPFVTPDGQKLFFSSQGHYNMGGYDIFFSQHDEDGRWLPPVNVGYPLNTTDDDLFYVPLDTGSIAYQSRFSEITAAQDIIRIKVSAYGKPARYTLNGKINLAADSLFNPSDITVTFVERKVQDTLSVKPLNNDGTFRQKLPGGSYLLHFTDGDKSLLEKNFDIPEYFPHGNLVFTDSITVTPAVMAVRDTLYLRDIRFAFDKSNLTQDQQQYLGQVAQLLKAHPGLTIQVSGYTDALGNAQYNLGLSRKRAGEVAGFLTDQDIGEERIAVKAYGEDHPVALNRLPDGSDSPVGRSYNRRVTFMVFNVPEKLVVIGVKDVPGEYLQH